MNLHAKLQLKPGQTVRQIGGPNLSLPTVDMSADAVLVFVKTKAELADHLPALVAAGKRGAVVWLAYPKAKQLDTDLNRDLLHEYMREHQLDAVRQIAIDDVWS